MKHAVKHLAHLLIASSLVKSNSAAHVEIWCGESHGAISVFTMRDGVVTSQEVVNHNDPVVENVEVFQVISESESGLVWTFVYPGCHIFQWSAGKDWFFHCWSQN